MDGGKRIEKVGKIKAIKTKLVKIFDTEVLIHTTFVLIFVSAANMLLSALRMDSIWMTRLFMMFFIFQLMIAFLVYKIVINIYLKDAVSDQTDGK